MGTLISKMNFDKGFLRIAVFCSFVLLGYGIYYSVPKYNRAESSAYSKKQQFFYKQMLSLKEDPSLLNNEKFKQIKSFKVNSNEIIPFEPIGGLPSSNVEMGVQDMVELVYLGFLDTHLENQYKAYIYFIDKNLKKQANIENIALYLVLIPLGFGLSPILLFYIAKYFIRGFINDN